MICPECKSTNAQIISTQRPKSRLLIMTLLFIFCLPLWLIALVIPKSQKNVKEAVCHNCGHSWKVK